MPSQKIVYSAEWASDPSVAAAVVSLLADELTKRRIEYKLTYVKGETVGLDLTPELKALKSDSDVYRCIVVDETFLEQANDALNHVYQNRKKELKGQALENAKQNGYVKTDEEFEQYSRDLSQAYGW